MNLIKQQFIDVEQYTTEYKLAQTVFLQRYFGIPEPDESMNPSQYRPLISQDDLTDIPDGFSVFAIISREGFSTRESKIVVLAKKHVSCEIHLRKMDTTFPSGYISVRIRIMHSQSPKGAFQNIPYQANKPTFLRF